MIKFTDVCVKFDGRAVLKNFTMEVPTGETLVILGGRDHFYGARSAARYRAASFLYFILCGWSASMPRRLFRSAS